jgi:glutathione S-transferase
MTLRLYFHPLSSFSHKVLIALYENATPFEPVIVNFFEEESAAAFKRIWPVGKIPVLRDETADRTVPESSIIIEYLDRHYPGATRFLSEDPDLARQTRMRDRFFDLYVHVPMQKIVTDKLRPEGGNDPVGVAEARAMLATTLGMIDRDLAAKSWAMGDRFTLADCAAAPALFYVNLIMPLAEQHPHAASYLDRLVNRPSYARALKEAEPYFKLFPG